LSLNDFEKLQKVNNTLVYENNKFPQSLDYFKYLTGHVRTIYFQANTKLPDKTFDPNVPATNDILYIYEGYFKAGHISETPTFGRWFKRNLNCYIGFFAIENDVMQFLF
jgi:hypothetical protein